MDIQSDVPNRATPRFQTELDLSEYPSEFRRRLLAICWKTSGDVSPDDLAQDVWMYTTDIGNERGSVFNVDDPKDQNLLVKKLYRAYMKSGDRKLRRAHRIDEEVKTEDGSYRWGDRLTAPELSDPFIALVKKEDAAELLGIFRASYSQAVAYAVTFAKFDNRQQRLSAYLAIAASTLMKRVSGAVRYVKQQPSLFDRIEHIPDDFIPLEGRALLPPQRTTIAYQQCALEFHT